MINYKLIMGNSLDELKKFSDNSIDSIVTDPPYELGFMGKEWDKSGIAFNKEIWEQCLRVLKPGGHLISFSGSRTYHRMAVAIEDAGFEIRDQIMWVYGSGFPKSLDVSKGIDKLDAKELSQQALLKRNLPFTEWMRSTGLTKSDINRITNTNIGSHYITQASQPYVATRKNFEMLRPYIKIEVPQWVEDLIDERTREKVESINFKNREVIGKKENAMSNWKMDGSTKFVDRNITAPSTSQAKKWQGWGTALKPAHEPMVLARKPFKGTVAENVLTHGVGAMNIDGCRVEYENEDDKQFRENTARDINVIDGKNFGGGKYSNPNDLGRWPANFIHDGIDTEWAKFFYCAKASKKDRNDGCEHLPKKAGGSTAKGFTEDIANGVDRNAPTHNHHPTVKPTDLMAYLVRLVTPPNGTVLDPFNGSGSTGKACAREGFNYIGIDLSQEYLDISKARIEAELNKKNKDLFD